LVCREGGRGRGYLELGGRQAHVALVLRLRDAQVLALDVHQLQLELGQTILGGKRRQRKDREKGVKAGDP